MLRVDNLGKRYGDRWVFRGINFSLSAGDALVVLGRNGAGKSTLLKAIAGLVSATEGKVTLPEGDPRTTVALSALDMHVYAHLTVGEHLEFASKLRGIDNDRTLLAKVGLEERTDQPAMELSSGMRARLKLALAIQAKPTLLLLDEPGAGLDEAGRQVLQEVCHEQIQRGCLLLATNDPLERRFGTLELELAS